MVQSQRPQARTSASRLRLAGLVGLLLPCACSLLTSFDGLSGAAGDLPDAAGDSSDAPADAGDGGNAPADAEAGLDAAAPFCSSLTTSPAFCADFDGVDPLLGWSKTLVTNNGDVVEPSTAAFRSAPRALRSSVGVAGDDRFAFLERNLATADHVRLSYSLWVDVRADYEVNILSFTGAGTNYDFYLAVDGTGASYVEQVRTADAGAAETPIPLTQVIPTKKWTRVVLDVSLSGTRQVVVTIDGVEAARKAVTYAQPGPVAARVGITYASPSTGPGVVFVDDFLVELL